MSRPLETREFRRPQGLSSILTHYYTQNTTAQGHWPSNSSVPWMSSNVLCLEGSIQTASTFNPVLHDAMCHANVKIWTIVLCFSSPEWTDKWTLEYYAMVIVLIQ